VSFLPLESYLGRAGFPFRTESPSFQVAHPVFPTPSPRRSVLRSPHKVPTGQVRPLFIRIRWGLDFPGGLPPLTSGGTAGPTGPCRPPPLFFPFSFGASKRICLSFSLARLTRSELYGGWGVSRLYLFVLCSLAQKGSGCSGKALLLCQ